MMEGPPINNISEDDVEKERTPMSSVEEMAEIAFEEQRICDLEEEIPRYQLELDTISPEERLMEEKKPFNMDALKDELEMLKEIVEANKGPGHMYIDKKEEK